MSNNSEFYLDSLIIQNVKENSMLYDLNHKLYKNNFATKIAWERVANKIGTLTSKECQGKWRLLKLKYTSIINRHPRSGSYPKLLSKSNQWLVKKMEFFQIYFIDNEPTESCFDQLQLDSNSNAVQELFEEMSDVSNNDFELSAAPFSPSAIESSSTKSSDISRKRKFKSDPTVPNELLKIMKGNRKIITTRSAAADIDPFFISLAKDVEKLNDYNKMQVKIAFLNIVRHHMDGERKEIS